MGVMSGARKKLNKFNVIDSRLNLVLSLNFRNLKFDVLNFEKNKK